jgi:5-deoxy-glucuronate isomerase
LNRLVTRGQGTRFIELRSGELGPGEEVRLDEGDDVEVAAVVLRGAVEASADGRELGMAGGREDVFEGPGHAVYAPPGARLALAATGAGAALAVASAPVADGGEPGPARVISPADQRIAYVGRGNWTRSVRTILGPEHPAGRLLLGETINPPGNWSSYPPHKHDRHSPPDEVELEEVYFFKFKPAAGFGVQVRYDGRHEEAFVVRDGDVALIPSGYHPVVAAPGYALYYLWVMAGRGREMAPRFDPHHVWVQEDQR